jgi:hypothetical protein
MVRIGEYNWGRVQGCESVKRTLRLLGFIAEASLIVAAGFFAPAVIEAEILVRPGVSPHVPSSAWAILPSTGLAAWWLFRKLKLLYSRAEAYSGAITFGLFAPIAALVATPFAQIPRDYASLLGSSFGLAGAFAGVVAITIVLTFFLTALALWVAHPISLLFKDKGRENTT